MLLYLIRKEEREMLNAKLKLLEIKKVVYFISIFALFFAYIGANSCCVAIFHQPEKPDLTKLRKL